MALKWKSSGKLTSEEATAKSVPIRNCEGEFVEEHGYYAFVTFLVNRNYDSCGSGPHYFLRSARHTLSCVPGIDHNAAVLHHLLVIDIGVVGCDQHDISSS